MDRSIPYVTISDFTRQYCLSTFNDDKKYFSNYLFHARMIWKRLFWDTIRTTKSVYVVIDKTTSPHSIKIPKDCVEGGIYNINEVDDCGNLQPYFFKDQMNDIPIPTINSKACKSCGTCNDYGELVNSYTATTKEEIIDNVVYYSKEYVRLLPNGDLYKITEVPAKTFDADGNYTIQYATSKKIIAQLETEPCGCFKKNDANQSVIISACGCIIPCTQSCFNNIIKKRVAKINVSQGRIFLENSLANYVILSYKTNGECGEEEILIPEFALDAMTFGVRWRAAALTAGQQNRFEKRDAKIDFFIEENLLFERLNPLRVAEFLENQGQFWRWGGGYSDQNKEIEGYNNLVKSGNPVEEVVITDTNSSIQQF